MTELVDPQLAMAIAVALSLAAATLASEDLTCVGAGVLVAQGRLPLEVALGGCLAGVVAGDVLLMLVGRVLGRRGLELPIVRRLSGPGAIARMESWFARRGAAVVALSRFVPGTRLPAYLAAGAFRMPLVTFTGYVTATALVWVPALVMVSALAGGEAVRAGLLSAGSGVFATLLVGAAVAAAVWMLSRAARLITWRARRRAYGLAQRILRWEFWPSWILYAPIAVYIAGLAIRHRSFAVVTAANPDIPGGGVIGESKFEILRALARAQPAQVARAALVPAAARAEARLAMARGFMERAQLTFPIVLKPDHGQRGSGVVIVRSHEELAARLGDARIDTIVQEFIGGPEFGLFYYRYPDEARGHLLSITEKRFPTVRGDGRSSLETLILSDPRAVCVEPVHRRVHRHRLARVPAAGQIVPLVEIGSHCRGAVFVDGGALATPALLDRVDRIAQQSGGFYFGRFDVRAPSHDDLRRGMFTILELNGITSEATHIYDPSATVWAAWRALATQWRIAFAIGAANRRLGIPPARLSELLGLARRYRRSSRLHPEHVAS